MVENGTVFPLNNRMIGSTNISESIGDCLKGTVADTTNQFESLEKLLEVMSDDEFGSSPSLNIEAEIGHDIAINNGENITMTGNCNTNSQNDCQLVSDVHVNVDIQEHIEELNECKSDKSPSSANIIQSVRVDDSLEVDVSCLEVFEFDEFY